MGRTEIGGTCGFGMAEASFPFPFLNCLEDVFPIWAYLIAPFSIDVLLRVVPDGFANDSAG